MALGGLRALFRAAAGMMGLCLLTLAMTQPASAGFFERLFGGVRRAVEAPPQAPLAFVDPFTSLSHHLSRTAPQAQFRVRPDARGPSKAFCVRTCDGRFFPVQAYAGMSAAESCRSFCPAAETRLFGGSNIDYATALDGSRYADLPNAFVYRKQMVAGCTCNGRNAFGLAPVEATNDPTLRQGDIVATDTGFIAYTGSRDNVAGFTPVANYSRLSKSMRERLADTKVAPPAPQTEASTDVTASIPPAAAQARAEAPRVQTAR